jgi:hypothetical protein
VLAAALLGLMAVGTAGARAVQSAATAAEAAPFLGDWVLALEGANGPGSFDVTLKVENDKVTGQIQSAQMPLTPFTSIATNAGKGLSMSFSFPYEGMTVDAVASLVPAEGGTTSAGIDFAGGAYTMSGTATKKEPAK